MQARGKMAMGVDQYTSKHASEPLADGGRIMLQRDAADTAGTTAIREHLKDIAMRFRAGDFAIPGFVHAQQVPGTPVMAARRSAIRYVFHPLPGGGEVRVVTRDSVAGAAGDQLLLRVPSASPPPGPGGLKRKKRKYPPLTIGGAPPLRTQPSSRGPLH